MLERTRKADKVQSTHRHRNMTIQQIMHQKKTSTGDAILIIIQLLIADLSMMIQPTVHPKRINMDLNMAAVMEILMNTMTRADLLDVEVRDR